MKKLILSLATIAMLAACSKDDDNNPSPSGNGGNGNGNGNGGGNVPAALVGQWQHGTFAMADYWGYDGSYQGNPFTQTVAFQFNSNGTYEMFYIGQTNNYGCVTDAFSWFKGTVQFTDSSFTVNPTQGTFRGYYTCTPGSNFSRPADASELHQATYYYHFETDEFNKTWLVIGFTPDDQYPSYFSSVNW